jgi:predicted Rossmann fold nucleotide-binding protein DprA/Smf involved in DNA uptake
MNVAIVGSRNFHNYDLFLKHVNDFIEKYDFPDKIISGGAKGADTLARRWAEEYGVTIKEYFPNWSLGRCAGPLRNKDIITNSTHMLAFPSKDGSGTQNAIKLAKEKGIKIIVIHYV